MRATTFLMLISCGLLIGCGPNNSRPNAAETTGGLSSDNDGQTTGASLSLDVADLEKLDDWDATSKASAKLTEMLAGIMSEISDRESASAAIPKLQELAPKFAAVNRAEKAFGDPSAEDQSLVLKNLAEAHRKFDEFYIPIIENEEIKAIVGQAIDDAYVGNVAE